ncbi:alpha/beta fold hydrolase, partial [Nocardia tenerifensis]|uniref:alpha/beta fold hydrolase n=1 Tax=Nocardia tenerifensis TaxID=228006 RepID=UPI0014613FAD
MTSVDYAIDGAPTGPPIVLSGSLGSDMRMWEPQVRAFSAAGYRVVRYDHRGHGRSPVPPGPYSVADLASDTLALLDRLGIDRAHFVGLSLGGMGGVVARGERTGAGAYPDAVLHLGSARAAESLGRSCRPR